MSPALLRGIATAVVLAGLAACGRGSEPRFPMRAAWVTRFEYRTESDVRGIVAAAADAGLDTLLFQVRGNATAFYRSSLEPWAEELGGEEPGFDPLAVACEEAASRGVALHAWVNVMPAWRGTRPPLDPRQLVRARPEWMWVDANGCRQPFIESFYVSVNPCLPAVRAYLVEVFREIVERYPVRGLHLDYIRFPSEPPVIPAGSGLDYPHDPATLGLFRAETGLAPGDEPAAWTNWRVEQVTRLVREIRAMLSRSRPDAALSAAVAADPERARARYFQDAKAWLAEGLLDVVLPMNYTAEEPLFETRLARWRDLPRTAALVSGVHVGLGEPDVHRRQMERALSLGEGFCAFSWARLSARAADYLPLPRGAGSAP